MISQDAVDDIGLEVGLDDRIVTYFGIGGKEYAFRKNIDSIQIGGYVIKNIEVDFNDFGYEDINGLLGLFYYGVESSFWLNFFIIGHRWAIVLFV
ncbi:hypothetical protein FH966_03605 [Lentibacillus cibarius]|uniref:Uncharacterized protein n=1 Tax=Lentibacillus cibarius TaxID=2583219 RepID=A0A549YG67_9BACI|nr:aspartyl protease family protein [Lentibacillus cibarius]TRM10876.1 hypothetical protein FH966_03605 [Lentibacillus cibarius]